MTSKGIVYFVQPAELVGTSRYKIGCSGEPTLKRCLNYLSGTRYICVMECSDPLAVETELKAQFAERYKRIAGKEWFEGDELEMLKTFVEIIVKCKCVAPKPVPKSASKPKLDEETIWLNKQLKPWTAETCANAAEKGYLKSLKAIHESGCSWKITTCEMAAKNGHLDCLKYAHENGCKLSKSLQYGKSLCALAALGGHLECLKYLHENGCPWDKYTCSHACQNNHFDCLKYAHTNGCPWNELSPHWAACNGRLDILKYLHKNKCPWNADTCENAAKYGHLDCLQYAHKNKCPWNKWTCTTAARNGNFYCLEYAYTNGCPCSMEECIEATTSIKIIKWIGMH